MSDESGLKAIYRKQLIKLGRFGHIENIAEVGTPDSAGVINGIDYWIEFKNPNPVVRPTSKLFGSSHKLEPEQENWHYRHYMSGGLSFIIIRSGKLMFTIPGKYAFDINELTVASAEAISMHRPNISADVAVSLFPSILVALTQNNYRKVKP